MLKKKLVVLVLGGMLVAAAPMTAYAHCHGGYSRSAGAAAPAAVPSYPVCAVADCQETALHYHDGAACMPHSLYDGHDYHTACGVAGCAMVHTHTHQTAYGSGYGHHGYCY